MTRAIQDLSAPPATPQKASPSLYSTLDQQAGAQCRSCPGFNSHHTTWNKPCNSALEIRPDWFEGVRGIPDTIAEAVRYHHDPRPAGQWYPGAAVVNLADAV
jgi:hypothetical protein